MVLTVKFTFFCGHFQIYNIGMLGAYKSSSKKAKVPTIIVCANSNIVVHHFLPMQLEYSKHSHFIQKQKMAEKIVLFSVIFQKIKLKTVKEVVRKYLL